MPSCPRAAVGLLAAAPSCAPLAELAARERPVEHAVERLRLWICGRSALPTGCASPTSRASSESGEMLAFAHIPTGTTANKGFDIDEAESILIEIAIAPTAIGAGVWWVVSSCIALGLVAYDLSVCNL